MLLRFIYRYGLSKSAVYPPIFEETQSQKQLQPTKNNLRQVTRLFSFVTTIVIPSSYFAIFPFRDREAQIGLSDSSPTHCKKIYSRKSVETIVWP
jgi:3-methyladenine DNA glycosylase AlkC